MQEFTEIPIDSGENFSFNSYFDLEGFSYQASEEMDEVENAVRRDFSKVKI